MEQTTKWKYEAKEEKRRKGKGRKVEGERRRDGLARVKGTMEDTKTGDVRGDEGDCER